MQTLAFRLENCHGIKALVHDLDFSSGRAAAFYAPNGSMKSSLLRTFQDVVQGRPSRDVIFTHRPTIREIKVDGGADINPTSILIVEPYSERAAPDEAVCTLLVDETRRQRYAALESNSASDLVSFLSQIRMQAKTREGLAEALAAAYDLPASGIWTVLTKIKEDIEAESRTAYADVPYDTIFDPKVVELLQDADVQASLADYLNSYEDLISKSPYFSHKLFNYHGAGAVAKTLEDSRYFDASHTMTLNGESPRQVNSAKDLADLVAAEKKAITDDPDLRTKFARVEKALSKNARVREFQTAISDHPEWLTELGDMGSFRKKVLLAYCEKIFPQLERLVESRQLVAKEMEEIEAAAASQQTQWEHVIEVFNRRFKVPFQIELQNRTSVMLGRENVPQLAFRFSEGADVTSVERTALLQVLSQGERKALYLLNVLFEIESRKASTTPVLLIFDDVADSFDYKNKYAIVQYLRDLAENPVFRLLILTHNFDFFRTLESRGAVQRSLCFSASRSAAGIKLVGVEGLKNLFTNVWKPAFGTSRRARVGCIAFMRNLIEYTRGLDDPDYLLLTKLVHWKPDTATITQAELDGVFLRLFSRPPVWPTPDEPVFQAAVDEANAIHVDAAATGLDAKVVLAIATRLLAEKHIVEKISDPAFVAGLGPNQTYKLLARYRKGFPSEATNLAILDRVLLMTPENIHLNSFMYEPILDMGDDHLRELYADVQGLS